MKFFNNCKKYGFGVTVGTALMAAAGSASAAIDVTGVSAGITAAETDAHTVGTLVITVIAGLTVVGIVIALVRKL